jgi:hypothetical protein
MEQIIEARFEEITPGKLGFRPEHVVSVAERVMMGKPLFPLVGKKSKYNPGMHVTLDPGNSRIIYAMMAGQESAPMFVAGSDKDKIPYNLFYPILGESVDYANRAIRDRWAECEITARYSGVENFRDYFERLLDKYPFLETVTKFLEYCAENRDYYYDHSIVIGGLEDL